MPNQKKKSIFSTSLQIFSTKTNFQSTYNTMAIFVHVEWLHCYFKSCMYHWHWIYTYFIYIKITYQSIYNWDCYYNDKIVAKNYKQITLKEDNQTTRRERSAREHYLNKIIIKCRDSNQTSFFVSKQELV